MLCSLLASFSFGNILSWRRCYIVWLNAEANLTFPLHLLSFFFFVYFLNIYFLAPILYKYSPFFILFFN